MCVATFFMTGATACCRAASLSSTCAASATLQSPPSFNCGALLPSAERRGLLSSSFIDGCRQINLAGRRGLECDGCCSSADGELGLRGGCDFVRAAERRALSAPSEARGGVPRYGWFITTGPAARVAVAAGDFTSQHLCESLAV
jgi:hypothetical protein